jgi:deoxyribonuclease-4
MRPGLVLPGVIHRPWFDLREADIAARAIQFGTVGAPISTSPKPGGSVGAVQRLAELGLGALELGWVQSVRVKEETCEAIRAEAQRSGVRISVHAPYYINLNASKEEWPKSRKRLMDAARYGNLAGASDIIFHPGSYLRLPPAGAGRRDPEIAKMRRGLLGTEAVTLRPETMGKRGMLGSLEDVLEMARGGGRATLPTPHLHANRRWQPQFDGRMAGGPSKLQSSRRASLRRLHPSLRDRIHGEGRRRHLPMAESDFDLEGFLRALVESGCRGRIVCESPVMEQDALLFQNTWDRLARKKG